MQREGEDAAVVAVPTRSSPFVAAADKLEAKSGAAAPRPRIAGLLMTPDAAFFFSFRPPNSVSIGVAVFYCEVNMATIINFRVIRSSGSRGFGDTAASSASLPLAASVVVAARCYRGANI